MKTARVFLALTMSILPAFGQSARVDEAARPLRDGVPEVAVVKLRALLEQNLSTAEWETVTERLAEALIATRRPNESLTLLDDPRVSDGATVRFWRGQALAAMERWSEALPLYEQAAAAADSRYRVEAQFGAAEALRALGRTVEAQRRLASLDQEKHFGGGAELRAAEMRLQESDFADARRILENLHPRSPNDRKAKRVLEARIALAEKHPEEALRLLEPVLERSQEASHAVAVAALFAAADAHLQLNTPGTADDLLEDFVDRYPDDVDLARIFAKLDQLYRAERKPARSQLERWTRDPHQPRRAFAQWYLGRIELRGGRRDRADRFFGELLAALPLSPALVPAVLDIAQTQVEARQWHSALATLEKARALTSEPAMRDRIDVLAAQAHTAISDLSGAADIYERVGYSDSGLAQMSIFNAAVLRLKAGDRAKYSADYAQVQKRGEVAAEADLRLQDAFTQAAKGDARAVPALRKYVRDFPNEARTSEAFVALAELAFHRTPPALDEARNYLAQARRAKMTEAARERGDYLQIWIDDAQGDDAKILEDAKQFLDRHPGSPLAADARMKLAETFYRRQDFANAQTQFETIAQENASKPIAEKALFFAAESAMSSMAGNAFENALVLFDRVVQLNGEWRWAARNEQAAIERRLGRPREALLLYEEVLKSEARPSEKREALCGKGDVYVELGASDPKNFELATAAYDQLVSDAREPGHWRNQALFKKATCLQKKGERENALSIFYDVLNAEPRSDRTPELFWFYKAGFSAARLLEDDGKWTSAAAIYTKLASAAGPRSDEAKARLNSLRLQHFLWEE